MTTGRELEEVQLLNVDGVDAGDVAEGAGQTLQKERILRGVPFKYIQFREIRFSGLLAKSLFS